MARHTVLSVVVECILNASKSLACVSEKTIQVTYLRAVAHAMLESEGFAVSLAAEIGFDDAKLELLEG